MKQCTRCKKLLHQDDFHISKKTTDGKIYYRNQCRKCHNAQKSKYKKRIAQEIADYKTELSCSRCGYSKTHPYFTTQALEFHHPNNDKSFTISNGVSKGRSFKEIKKEMNKCEVVCCRCHKLIHYK